MINDRLPFPQVEVLPYLDGTELARLVQRCTWARFEADLSLQLLYNELGGWFESDDGESPEMDSSATLAARAKLLELEVAEEAIGTFYEEECAYLEDRARGVVIIADGLETRRVPGAPHRGRIPARKVRARAATRVLKKFPSPAGLKWAEVKVTFISSESLKIEACGVIGKYHFSEIGFKDERKGDRPNTLWELLLLLARYNGYLAAKERSLPGRKGSFRAHAFTELRNSLKAILGIKEDPFEAYKEANGYKAKFQIEDKSYGGSGQAEIKTTSEE